MPARSSSHASIVLIGIAAKRRAALLAPFAFATDVRARSEHDVAAVEVDQFRDAQARLQRPEAGWLRSLRPIHVDRSGAESSASISVRSMKSTVRRT